MKDKQEHIDETLLLKVIEDRANEKERNLFTAWIKASENNAEAFEQLKKTNQITFIDKNSLKRNWESLVGKVQSGKEVPEYIELPDTAKPKSIKRKLNTLIRIAAMFILLLGISFLLKTIVFNSEQQTIYGNQLNPKDPYQLADGSMVYLNKDSEISFSKKFGRKDRKMTLKGEAFFEVKRNEKIPFVISTYKTKTQVLGTKFNIYSDQSEQVKVSVVSGLVAFYTNKSNHQVELSAGENGICNSGMASVEKELNNDSNFLAWKTGTLHFTATPLTEAFHLLQKQYSRVFVFESNDGDFPALTTIIDNMPLEAVLEELNLLLNAKNVCRNDTIIFKPNG